MSATLSMEATSLLSLGPVTYSEVLLITPSLGHGSGSPMVLTSAAKLPDQSPSLLITLANVSQKGFVN
jgi:hypothetical protein